MFVIEFSTYSKVPITLNNIAQVISQIFNNHYSNSSYNFKAIFTKTKFPDTVVFTHFALIKDKITIGYINVKFLVEIQTKQKNVEDQKLEITTNDKFIINLLTKVDNLNDSIARKLPPIQKLTRKDLHDVQDHRKAQNSILLKYTEQRFQFENPQDDPSDPMQVLRSDVLRDTTVNNKKIIPNGNNLSVSMNPEVKAALQNELFTLDDIDHLKQAYSQDLFSFFTNILSGSLTSPLLISDTGFEMSPVQNNHKKNISKSNDGTIYYTYTCDYIRFNHNDSKADLIVNSRKIRFQCAVGYLYGPHEVKFKLTPSHNDQEKWVFELAEINTPNPIIYNIMLGYNLGIENGKFVTIDPHPTTPSQTPDNTVIPKPR